MATFTEAVEGITHRRRESLRSESELGDDGNERVPEPFAHPSYNIPVIQLREFVTSRIARCDNALNLWKAQPPQTHDQKERAAIEAVTWERLCLRALLLRIS